MKNKTTRIAFVCALLAAGACCTHQQAPVAVAPPPAPSPVVANVAGLVEKIEMTGPLKSQLLELPSLKLKSLKFDSRLDFSQIDNKAISDTIVDARKSVDLEAEDKRKAVRAFDDLVRAKLETSVGEKFAPLRIDDSIFTGTMYSNLADILRRRDDTSTFIGDPVKGEQRVEVVSMRPANSVCTAVVIARNAIATASHCARDNPKFIRLGTDADFGRTIDLTRPFVFLSSDDGVDLDMAVMIMDESNGKFLTAMGLTDDDLPVFAPDSIIAAAHELSVVGFGGYRNDSSLPGTKRLGIVPMQSPACRPEEAAHFGCNPGFDIVAGTPRSGLACNFVDENNPLQHGACKGDSGGPAYVLSADNKLLMAGLIRAVNDLDECGCGATTNLYVRFDKLKDKLVTIPGIDFPPSAFALVTAAARTISSSLHAQ